MPERPTLAAMHKNRALLVSLVALAAATAAVYLRQAGTAHMPGCHFRKLTNLECPGCGMTRATYALLHGRISEAFHFNPVGIVLLPLALIMIGIEVLGWVRGKPLPIRTRPGLMGSLAIATVMIGWFILRNVI